MMTPRNLQHTNIAAMNLAEMMKRSVQQCRDAHEAFQSLSRPSSRGGSARLPQPSWARGGNTYSPRIDLTTKLASPTQAVFDSYNQGLEGTRVTTRPDSARSSRRPSSARSYSRLSVESNGFAARHAESAKPSALYAVTPPLSPRDTPRSRSSFSALNTETAVPYRADPHVDILVEVNRVAAAPSLMNANRKPGTSLHGEETGERVQDADADYAKEQRLKSLQEMRQDLANMSDGRGLSEGLQALQQRVVSLEAEKELISSELAGLRIVDVRKGEKIVSLEHSLEVERVAAKVLMEELNLAKERLELNTKESTWLHRKQSDSILQDMPQLEEIRTLKAQLAKLEMERDKFFKERISFDLVQKELKSLKEEHQKLQAESRQRRESGASVASDRVRLMQQLESLKEEHQKELKSLKEEHQKLQARAASDSDQRLSGKLKRLQTEYEQTSERLTQERRAVARMRTELEEANSRAKADHDKLELVLLERDQLQEEKVFFNNRGDQREETLTVLKQELEEERNIKRKLASEVKLAKAQHDTEIMKLKRSSSLQDENIDALTRSLDEERSTVARLRRELEQAASNIGEDKLEILQLEHDHLQADILRLKSKGDQREETLSVLKQELEEERNIKQKLASEVKLAKVQYDTDMMKLKRSSSLHDETVDALRRSLDEERSTVARLRRELEQAGWNIEDAEKLEILKLERDDLQADILHLKNKGDLCEEARSSLQQELQEERKIKQALTTEVKVAKAQYDTDMIKLRRSHNDLRQSLDEERREIARLLDLDLDILTESNSEQQSSLENLRCSVDDGQTIVAELRSWKNQQQEIHDMLKRDFGAERRTVARLSGELESNDRELVSLRSERDQLREELLHAQSAGAARSRALSEMRLGLEQSSASSTAELLIVTEQLEIIEAERDKLLADVSSLKESGDEREMIVVKLRRELDVQKDSMQTLSSDVIMAKGKYEATLATHSSNILNLEMQRKQLSADVEDLRSMGEQKERTIRELKELLEQEQKNTEHLKQELADISGSENNKNLALQRIRTTVAEHAERDAPDIAGAVPHRFTPTSLASALKAKNSFKASISKGHSQVSVDMTSPTSKKTAMWDEQFEETIEIAMEEQLVETVEIDMTTDE